MLPLIQNKMAHKEMKLKIKEENKQILLATFGYHLPVINKNIQFQYTTKKSGRNNAFGTIDFQNPIKPNVSNNSFEFNRNVIKTQYSKKNYNYNNNIMNNIPFIPKKTKYLSVIPNKSKYISPYSQKIMSNNLLL